MKDISSFITSILKPLSIPNGFQTYSSGTNPMPDQYITFLEYTNQAELEAGDVEITTERLIQLNVWSKSNYYSMVENVRTTMEQAGFLRTDEYDAPYTDGDIYFNKVIRFAFYDDYQ
jgi:hypothetical protein